MVCFRYRYVSSCWIVSIFYCLMLYNFVACWAGVWVALFKLCDSDHLQDGSYGSALIVFCYCLLHIKYDDYHLIRKTSVLYYDNKLYP